MASTPNTPPGTPGTPESKPKSGFMGMLDKMKTAVTNIVPDNMSMENIKQKVKDQAESVSAKVKNIDMTNISNKIKETSDKIKETTKSVTGQSKDSNDPENKNKPKQ
jgi:FtsZ-binding cell division protein ZapB